MRFFHWLLEAGFSESMAESKNSICASEYSGLSSVLVSASMKA